VTYIGIVVSKPAMARQPGSTLLTLLYVVLTDRLVSTLSTEASRETVKATSDRLQRNMRDLKNEVRLGEWKYAAVDGVIILAFGAERLDSALPPSAQMPERTITAQVSFACRDFADLFRGGASRGRQADLFGSDAPPHRGRKVRNPETR
jgi:hypothetical protein